MNIKKYINLQEKSWENLSYSVRGNGIWKIPSMLTHSEKKMLSYLTEFIYEGEGKILDLGCFLGGSTAFLAHGLTKNINSSGAIDSFDLFKLGKYELNNFFPRNNLTPPPNLDSEDMFLEYIAPFRSIVNVHKGNILDFKHDSSKIEILFIDIMKSTKIYDKVVKEFFLHLIPSKSIIIFQDYYFNKSGVWHHVLVHKLRDKLKKVADPNINSNIFVCIEKISNEEIQNCLWENISYNDKIESVFFALENCESKEQQEILKAILQTTLENENENKGLEYNFLYKKK